MTCRWILTVLALVTVTGFVAAADGPQFRWRSGQVLTYRVTQSTEAVETLKDETLKTLTKLDVVKKWQVVDVDTSGTATLQMTLTRLRMENKPPTGDPLLFDSADPAKSHAQLREEMGKYVGPPLTIVRIDTRGRLVEVKESKFGPESRLQSDLPFKLTLPDGPFAAGQKWERAYQIKLDPPQGAGESYESVQAYTCKAFGNNLAQVHVTTTLKAQPDAAADKLPLLPLLPEGELYFDSANGLLKAVRYQFGQDVDEHRGEGSKYQFKSTYTEDLIESK